MKKQLFIIAVFYLWCHLSYAQTWLWAKSAHGAFDDWGQSIAVDHFGNTYVAGRFTSTSFVIGTTTLKNSDSTNTGNTGMSMDIFIAKYDINGNFLWAKSAWGSDNMDERAFSVAVDASGNAYITGMYSSPTLSFDGVTITNAGIENIFLAKYDANGNIKWAKSTGGTSHDWGYSVAVDTSGNIYLTGVFQSPTIIFGTTTLTNLDNTSNFTDLFLAKYDSLGNVLWANKTGGTNYDWAMAVTVDASNKVILTGNFYSPSITFGSNTFTNSGLGDIFIAKYDVNGDVLWAKKAGGTDDDNASSVAVTASGEIYIAGNFNSYTLTFGSSTLTNHGISNIFIAKYDAGGNPLWAKSGGGTETDMGYSVAADPAGNAYITGAFFSPSITFGSTLLLNSGFANIFVAKYASGGNLLFAESIGGTDNDGGLAVAVDAMGFAYITGWFRDLCPFGSTTLSNVDPVFAGSDLFVAKLSSVTTEINEKDNASTFVIAPNPSNGKFVLNSSINISSVEIFDIVGKRIFQSEINNQKSEIDLSSQPKGIYFVKVTDGEKTHTEKIVIQ